ncbi:hypothetical protein BDV12DRAFT_34315 [Aspergillus spectabilis]
MRRGDSPRFGYIMCRAGSRGLLHQDITNIQKLFYYSLYIITSFKMTTITEKQTYNDSDDMYTSEGELSDIEPMPLSLSSAKPITQRRLSSSTASSSANAPKSRRNHKLQRQTRDLVPQTQQVAPKTTTKSIQRPEGEDIEQADTIQTEKKEDNGLKLRLDLNLDIEIELKAKIHGDLTLALLS